MKERTHLEGESAREGEREREEEVKKEEKRRTMTNQRRIGW